MVSPGPENREAVVGLLVALSLVVVAGALVAVLVHLGRGRARVMGYHDIETPRLNERTRGENGGATPWS